jgi:hypothetical protein
MTVRTLYFDESGYTGYNLLDPLQPIFAVASSYVNENDAQAILTNSFCNYRGSEFKFSNIWKSSSREGLKNFVGIFKERPDSSFAYVIDKKLGVLTKIVDFLIEPSVTNDGYDFYDDGFCWKYTNYIYYGLTQFAPPEMLEVLLRNYQAFSRDPTDESLKVLAWKLRLMANSSDERIRSFLLQMADGADRFHHFNTIETFKSSNELHTTSMIASVTHWRQRHDEDFAVIHDHSSTFLRSREMWECVTSPDVAQQDYNLGDGSKAQFPLRVVSTTAMDSKISYAIQFCDLVAGITTKFLGTPADHDDRPFLESLLDHGLGYLTINGIMSSKVFPDRIPPKRLNGPDSVDRMSAIIQLEKDRRLRK